ncbi:MAG: rhodanese-related sulfurtransferase [Lysobacterales bacterium]
MTAAVPSKSHGIWQIAAFYQFQPVDDPQGMVDHLVAEMTRIQQRQPAQGATLLGTVLVAGEGINGTIAGSSTAIEEAFALLHGVGFQQLMRRNTRSEKAPFHRLKVRLKREIVSMGQALDENSETGQYVEPEQWDQLISRADVVVVDTRNRYETDLGSFAGAIAPDTDSFRDFPTWSETHLNKVAQPKVAMFCTGGIRCEKATAYLKSQGFEEVFHLRGGILNYLERVPQDQSSWQGECFVFDDRVTVNHQLEAGTHQQCFNCRMPLTELDLIDQRYEQHVSCPQCFDRVDEKRRSSLLERARQITLARERGQSHLGAKMPVEDQS